MDSIHIRSRVHALLLKLHIGKSEFIPSGIVGPYVLHLLKHFFSAARLAFMSQRSGAGR